MADGAEGQEKATIGFRIAGKARPKVAVSVKAEEEHRQLVVGVSDNGILQTAEATSEQQRQYVIPKLQNTYKAGVGKFVPSFVPESSAAAVTGTAEDRYERAVAPDQPAITSFGLEVRGPKEAAQRTDTNENDRPLVPTSAKDEAAQLKEDLEHLPEEATVDVRTYTASLAPFGRPNTDACCGDCIPRCCTNGGSADEQTTLFVVNGWCLLSPSRVIFPATSMGTLQEHPATTCLPITMNISYGILFLLPPTCAGL